MKKKLLVKRILSIMIALALWVSAVPISLAVQNLFVEETTSKIVREVIELREESVKHFLCEDGSYIAATYSAPVHYKENDEWKEIDNSLSLDRSTLSESGKPTYTTKAGGLSVSIPQSFSDGQKITAQNKGYKIGFGVNANQNDASLKASASVVELEKLSSNTEVVKLNTVKSINNVSTSSNLGSNDIEAYNAEIMTVDNQSSAVTYKEIFPDTDFEYVVTGNSIKENIVVYEPQVEYSYSFDMDFDGLTPIVNPDNSISLVEPSNPDETIFFIEAPYMYDANKEESIGIEMSLVSNGDEYVMTLVANAEWINDPERIFPVVIDPTIQLLNSSINDVFVINGLYANSARIKDRLRIGRNLTNLTRTYIKMAVPNNVPEGSIINSATLTLKKDNYYQSILADDISVKVYDCCNVNSWDINTISWNNQPFNNSNNGYDSTSGALLLDSVSATSGTNSYSFNITEAVKRWVDKGTNNGIMLASSNESTKTQIDFCSTRVSDETNRPTISLNYVPSGISQSSWSADSESSTSPEINITTSKEWIATTNQSWLAVSPSSGTDSSTFRVSVTENTSTNERTGIVVVTSGNTVIGTLNVTQFGADPSIVVDQSYFKIDSEGKTVEVKVTSNVEWTYSNSDVQMLNQIDETQDDAFTKTLSINISENVYDEANNASGGEIRIGTLTLQDTENYGLTTLIIFKQYNAVTECLFDIAEDETLTLKSSSEYNHALATWAMELSYAAYNPISDLEAIPGIPSNFREPPFNNDEWTAKADLESKGFEATMFNYESDSVAAHVIGHRTIEIDNIEINNDNLIGEIENDGKNTLGSISAVGLYTGTGMGTDSGMAANDSRYSFSSLISNSGENEATVSNSRQLVVVSVRGSVTILDWLMDLLTQFHGWYYDFDVGAQKVIDSLYGYDNCTECDGSNEKCPCKGYLVNNNITDPIIIVTGHSMGAAIANLVAAELNEIEGAGDVYGYTFATPTVKAYPLDEVITQPTNIFNILNTNDVVTYVPTSLLLPGINLWSRYGIDIPLNMRFSEEEETDFLGVESHSMAVYMNWMEDNSNMTHETIMAKSAEARTRGLLPWIARIKCPVGVTIKDNDGNIIAYESQEEGITYPDVTDTGIVSWITEEGEKMFFIPSGVDVASIEIEAYDYGSMDFAVGTAGTTDETEIKIFNDVSLYPGKEFLVEVSEDTLPEDTQLFVTENGEIVGEVTETDPHLKSVTVTHEEKTDRVVTYLTFVTDNTVSEIRLYRIDGNSTNYIFPTSSHVTVVEDGDNLIWTAGYLYNSAGDYSYDVSVKSGEEWYYYENVFSVHIPQEYIDYQENTVLEVNSINATTETTPVVII